MSKTSKQLTGSFKFKAIILMSAVVLMAVTMPAYAVSTDGDRDNNARSEQIILCHSEVTISVSIFAVVTHLAHGDTIGPCFQQ